MDSKQEEFVGIDVSKASLDCALLRSDGTLVSKRFDNDAAGQAQLIVWARTVSEANV